MPRIPRCISSVFVWWIQAASMKHTSPCWPGRYGESSKPMKVPTRPKIMIQGPVGQIALNVAVWATYRKGMGKTSVKHNIRARSAPGKTSGSSKVWDKLISLEHELRVERFLGDTSSTNLALVFPHLSCVFTVHVLFVYLRKSPKWNMRRSIHYVGNNSTALFFQDVLVRSRYPRTNKPEKRYSHFASARIEPSTSLCLPKGVR